MGEGPGVREVGLAAAGRQPLPEVATLHPWHRFRLRTGGMPSDWGHLQQCTGAICVVRTGTAWPSNPNGLENGLRSERERGPKRQSPEPGTDWRQRTYNQNGKKTEFSIGLRRRVSAPWGLPH